MKSFFQVLGLVFIFAGCYEFHPGLGMLFTGAVLCIWGFHDETADN